MIMGGLIAQEKAQYRDAFERLRGLKTEIEHRQRIAGQDRARRRADFGRWLGVMRRQAELPAPTEAELGGDPDAHDYTSTADRTAPAALPDTLPTALASTASAASGRSEVLAADRAAAGEAADPSTRAVRPAAAAGPQRLVAAAEVPISRARHDGPGAAPAQEGLEPGTRQQDGGKALHAVEPISLSREDLQDALQTATALVAANESQVFQASRSVPGISGSGADAFEMPQPQPAVDPYADVDPEVLRAAKPMLTGNLAADRSIIQFYEARAALLRSQAFRSTL